MLSCHMAKKLLLPKRLRPEELCKRQAEEIRHEFMRIASAPPGDQTHDAKRLHAHIRQALERLDHWAGRIDDGEWLDKVWSPVMRCVLLAVDALEAHLAVYPDPEIARFVRGYRQALADFEQHQTTPGVVEVPFNPN
jgi:hypothetical protein